MKILIYGAGAVGQAVGCMLAANGNTVDMIVRERFAEPLRTQGIKVTGIFGNYEAAAGSFGVFAGVGDAEGRRYDYVLVTVKSYDTDQAVKDIASLEPGGFTVVSMQNGCGNIEKLVERFGGDRSLGGRVITGFEIESPGLIRITVTADDVHIGGSREGEISEPAAVIAEAINASGLPCIATAHIRRDLYAKLLYNCALNPLGAALGVHYGALGDDPDTREIMNATIREVFSVIEAMGGSTHWDSPEKYQAFFYGKQVPATYNHRSSMLQDLEKGKRTEVEALTGYVSAQGIKFDVPTPVCDTLSGIIRFREAHGE